jgi:3-hydroxyisobutyrate dehydrogenase-like beta-hydroxyacid dehydrogenase
MGAALAARVGRAGENLTVWNRTRAKAEPLREYGARVARSLDELARCDVVFTTVAADPDLVEVVGVLLAQQGRAPRYLVDCSTVTAETSGMVRAYCAERYTRFLAAGVSGNAKAAEAGNLSVVVSGAEEAYTEMAPLLALLGRSVTYVGTGEAARLVKLCHNLLLGVLTQSMAEVTVLCEKGGVSRTAFLDFLNSSVLGSVYTGYKAPQFVKLDYTPTFTTALLRKDFDYGLAAARELDVPMPLAAATAQLLQAVIGAGYADQDFAALLEIAARGAGLPLTSE